ncbi:MAG: hypothetical protein QM662_00725 [Gordonia sp. (in: high G+C Gram-positive bacteria)]
MNTPRTDAADHAETRRRSPALAVLGIVALAIAGWGLADGPALPDIQVLIWLAVGAALVAGVTLVIAGARAGRR